MPPKEMSKKSFVMCLVTDTHTENLSLMLMDDTKGYINVLFLSIDDFHIQIFRNDMVFSFEVYFGQYALFLKYIYHMFNIILPKPCEIFAKFLLKICQKFGKGFTRFFNKYNSGTF